MHYVNISVLIKTVLYLSYPCLYFIDFINEFHIRIIYYV